MERQRAEITYPCRWLFKIIGQEETAVRRAIGQAIGQAGNTGGEATPEGDPVITPSNRSGGGRYHCLNLEMTVPDEASRDRIFLALKNHPHIKMVL